MQSYRSFLAIAAVAVATVSAPVQAGPVVAGFNNLGTIAKCDDCFTSAISTGFATNFFGTTYNQLFISNNGYFTFNSGQGSFTPGGLGAGYTGQPIIAGFFGDVDTRPAAGGTVTFGTGTFAGRTAFGATWNAVGYFSGGVDKLNTFQILLTDRSDVGAGDFDIYLHYDRIQWETGGASGGTNGLGGVSAAVGFNAGTGNAPGTFFELAGSRVPGSFLDTGSARLINTSNTGVAGQLRFAVRNGAVDPVDPGIVPEPTTWMLMIIGFGAVGVAARRRNARVTA